MLKFTKVTKFSKKSLKQSNGLKKVTQNFGLYNYTWIKHLQLVKLRNWGRKPTK